VHAPGISQKNKFLSDSFSDLLVIMTSTQPLLLNELNLEKLNCEGVYMGFPNYNQTI